VQEPGCLPNPEGHGEVFQLWYFSDKAIHSAKLAGALDGEERIKWWDAQKALAVERYGALNFTGPEEPEPAAGAE
jgi:hypothetical protein